MQIVASDNRIRVIDVDGLQRLPVLTCLDLSNNNIDTVPCTLGLLENIKSLKLEGLRLYFNIILFLVRYIFIDKTVHDDGLLVIAIMKS